MSREYTGSYREESTASRGAADDRMAVGKSTLTQSLDEAEPLVAERVGEEPDDEPSGPPIVARDAQAGKQELAAVAGGPADAGAPGTEVHDPPPPPADGGGGGAVAGGSDEPQQAAAAVETEGAAYKAEVAARQQQLEAEQHALALAQLKTMSSADKRSTLVDLGYDPKKVQSLKDAELDSLISGKLEAEQQKTKILGMTPEELAGLSAAQKTKFLTDLGIDRADLDKAGPQKTGQLFGDVIKAAHVPGTHKVKIQIKGGLFGKSWVVTVKCDTDGGVDMQAKKEGGLLSKVLGFVKGMLPMVLTVLAPLTGGASLIALSVYQAVNAIKSGNWLGAAMGVVGAVAGIGVLSAVKNGVGGLAQALQKVAAVAGKVQKVGDAAQKALAAVKAKNAGSLIGALAEGAGAFAKFASNAAGKFATTMTKWGDRLKTWGQRVGTGQNVVSALKRGDELAAIGGALSMVAAAAGDKTKTGKDFARAASITNFVNAGKKALDRDPPDYGAVAEAAFGIAAQLHQGRRTEDAAKVIANANKLKAAWAARATNPGAVADAALALAESIQTAKYDFEHDEKKDDKGKPLPDAERTKLIARQQRATKVVHLAGTVLTSATKKPPDYLAAADAATQLIAEFTDDKRLDAAAVVTAKSVALRKAIASGNPDQIAAAGIDLARSIEAMRGAIEAERDQAKQALPDHEGDDGGELPKLPPDFDRAPGLPRIGLTDVAASPAPGDKDPKAGSVDLDTISIGYGGDADSSVVPLSAETLIKLLLAKAGDRSCTITSTARTPEAQARAMYQNLESQGVQSQRSLYGPFGDQVIDVYVEAKAARASAAEIQSAMVAKIYELGPSNVSKHCADPATLCVVDIAPSSIGHKPEFVAAVQEASQIHFLGPPNDPAYHLEIPVG